MAVELHASNSAQENRAESELTTGPDPANASDDTRAPEGGAASGEPETTSVPASSGFLRHRHATSALAVAALVLIVLAATQLLAWRSARAEQRDGASASAVAQKAVPALLSYDYRHLAADMAAARPYLSDAFATEYDQVAASTVQPSAVSRQVVTSAAVTGTSVVSHGQDSVVVLLFVNQTTSALPADAKGAVAPKAKPVQSLDLSRVRVLMQRTGGQWRVADLRGL